ncbi:cilia- and flagella-associated protein 68 isoform X2 [Meriones unguiculatus]|uniref:cilia- and flagella-associated protein 68 isoform X2 n=1 Tax=Meriones unguiculatus TaxID=10047 RepID=UPI00293ED945|nr:cilia- and flagella-associated protein 68 isoform X2 [Meriones unguiculatus]
MAFQCPKREKPDWETFLRNMEQPHNEHCFWVKFPAKSWCSPSTYSTAQNLIYFLKNPHYGSLLHADGHGEVWTDWNKSSKFSQYGWRCNTNENSYSIRTLMGNWNQERYDLKNIVTPKPLPSQFGHYFETTYDANYNSKKPQSAHRFKREPHWFPGHQPELDPPHNKCTGKSIYMSSYSEPVPTHYSWCICAPNMNRC